MLDRKMATRLDKDKVIARQAQWAHESSSVETTFAIIQSRIDRIEASTYENI